MMPIISDVLSGVPAAGLAAWVDGAGPEPTLKVAKNSYGRSD